MAFDGLTIACIVNELNTELLGCRIAKIAQPEPDELLLTIHKKRLVISASPSLPLVYLAKENKTSPMQAPNFCMLLRKHIANGKITSITQPNMERIIEFEIEHLDEMGDYSKKILIAEFMGKHSNIIFCQADGTIIDSIKHISANVSSLREVLPGRKYFVPDTMEKENPLTITKDNFISRLNEKPMPLYKAIYNSLTGISPVVANEICARGHLDSSITPSSCEKEELITLYTEMCLFLQDVKAHRFNPAIYYENEEPIEYCTLPLLHFGASNTIPFSTISDLLINYYAKRNDRARIRQKSADLRQIIQISLERNCKKYDLQFSQLEDTKKRDIFKVYGELLNTYGYASKPGDKKLEALNYYTNEMLTIPLNPLKTAGENAKHYFEKYNKLKRTHEALSSLIKETKDEITYLDSVQNALDIAKNEVDLKEIKEELISVGYIKNKGGKKKASKALKPLHYKTSHGLDLFVGRNNLQNDTLTFQMATGNDWWFHAKGIPGSHVILITPKDEEIPDAAFIEAGQLAAYYSKGKGGDKVEIDYIQKKHIKKPKGGKPGFVIYHTNYSLVTNSDISTLLEIK